VPFTGFRPDHRVGRGANSSDASRRAALTSSIARRRPYRSSELANRWIRRSHALSSLMSVFPRSKKSQRASCIVGLYQALLTPRGRSLVEIDRFGAKFEHALC
jgi:hypothetical protein